MDNENKREYDNAVKYIGNEFIIPYSKTNINPQLFTNIPKLRQLINDYLSTYQDKVPDPITEKIDLLLQYELSSKQLIDASNLLQISNQYPISLWQGDITTLHIDCIVNAANSNGLGCFTFGHKCIDNQIHGKAGPRMREECKTRLGNNKIESGNLIITLGYNLPSRYVFHTVGPIYNQNNKVNNRLTLIKCYLNCLNKLKDIKKSSIAFSCISTGEYGYPKEEACIIALNTVKRWICDNPDYKVDVVFCVFTDEDKKIYKNNMMKYFN